MERKEQQQELPSVQREPNCNHLWKRDSGPGHKHQRDANDHEAQRGQLGRGKAPQTEFNGNKAEAPDHSRACGKRLIPDHHLAVPLPLLADY